MTPTPEHPINPDQGSTPISQLSLEAFADFSQLMTHRTIAEIVRETDSNIVLTHDEMHTLLLVQMPSDTALGPINWLRIKLRDRQRDGSDHWEQTELSGTRVYWHAEDTFNTPERRGLELSIYAQDPRYPLTSCYSVDQTRFIQNPYEALPTAKPSEKKLRHWLATWQKIVNSNNPPYPGYIALHSIASTTQNVLDYVFDLAEKHNYTHITAVPTWYHIAHWLRNRGFVFTHEKDASLMEQVDAAVDDVTLDKNKIYNPFIRHQIHVQQSWLVMRQFWAQLAEKNNHRPEKLCADIGDMPFILRDENGKLVLYPLNPNRNLWMEYDLSQFESSFEPPDLLRYKAQEIWNAVRGLRR